MIKYAMKIGDKIIESIDTKDSICLYKNNNNIKIPTINMRLWVSQNQNEKYNKVKIIEFINKEISKIKNGNKFAIIDNNGIQYFIKGDWK